MLGQLVYRHFGSHGHLPFALHSGPVYLYDVFIIYFSDELAGHWLSVVVSRHFGRV